jgi:peptidoglycan/LPS O-acetylase OafA/YrhL
VPAYWLALTALGLTVGLVDLWTADWWRYYGLLQVYDQQTILSGIPAAWSVCTEVAFYAVLPLYVLVRTRVAPRPGAGWVARELTVLGGLAALATLVRVGLKADGHHMALADTLPGTADWFALGMGLAVLSVAAAEAAPITVPRLFRRPSACWTLAAAAFALTCVAGLPRAPSATGFPGTYTMAQFLGEHAVYGLIALLLVAPAVFASADGRSAVARTLGNRWLRRLGIVSYGVFLYHVPIELWVQQHGFPPGSLPGSSALDGLVISIVLSVAAATGSYVLVERPLLRLKDRGREVGTRKPVSAAA